MNYTFERVLIIGSPATLPASLRGAARSWFAIAKPEELERSPVRLDDSLGLTFPGVFNINEYLEHVDEILEWTSRLIAAHGPLDRVIAPTEYTIQIGSLVRERFGIPGWKPEQSARVRDKGVMKARMVAAGVPTASHLDLALTPYPDAVSAWACSRPGKLVLKPKNQAGSRGVEIHPSAPPLLERLAGMTADSRSHLLVEDFVDWPLLHIDGLARDGELQFVAASRYLDPCLAWLSERKAMGSVLLTDPHVLRRVAEFTRQVLHALELPDLTFHLEAFFNGKELQFLEIAGRPGGAAIVPHLRSQYAIDLQEEMILCDLLLPKRSPAKGLLATDGTPRSGGWIATPMPTSKPCRVIGMSGLDALPPSLFDADLPSLGSHFNLRGDEGLASGRFHVRTHSEEETEQALQTIAQRYTLLVTEVPSPA